MERRELGAWGEERAAKYLRSNCLLYTSDAADEL